MPLTTQRGHVVGALCVHDHVPRQLSAVHIEILELCALQLVATFESRRKERHFADERESLEIHRQFFDLSPVLLCTIDEHLSFRELSPGWEEVLGWKRALLRSRDLSELVHPDDVERTRAELRRVAGEGIRRRNFEMRMKHDDGHWYRCHGRVLPSGARSSLPPRTCRLTKRSWPRCSRKKSKRGYA